MNIILFLLGNLLWFLLGLFLMKNCQSSLLTLDLCQNRLECFCSIAFWISQNILYQSMVWVQDDGVAVRHLTIEVHTLLELTHSLHSSHPLVLCDDYRFAVLTQSLHFNGEFRFFYLRKLWTEYLCQIVGLLMIEVCLFGIFFHDKALNCIRINANKTRFLKLLFKHVHHWSIQLTIHQEHRISLVLCSLDIWVLLLFVVGIEIN